uniref:SixA phosphatase family protein n=1 Tax=Flavobacterium sp. TaxID=239 RepID=UPI00404B6DBB
MKHLTLIRHAKSSWDSPTIDKNRDLSSKGIKNAHLIAQEAQAFLPKTNLIWSSTAKRASETALIFAQNLNWPLESIIYMDDLYTFDMRELVKIIKTCNNSYENVIIFGHNEAITHFVNKFGDNYIDNVPTSGVVSFELPIDSWQDLKPGKIKKTLFPRDLQNE